MTPGVVATEAFALLFGASAAAGAGTLLFGEAFLGGFFTMFVVLASADGGRQLRRHYAGKNKHDPEPEAP